MNPAFAAEVQRAGTGYWRHRAVCRDEDPELFFPVGTSGPAVLQIAEAVCHWCPVAHECLAEALAAGDVDVRGGLSEDERESLVGGKRNRYPASKKG